MWYDIKQIDLIQLGNLSINISNPIKLPQFYQQQIIFQNKAYEYWRKGCDTHATVPHAKACLNAALLDSMDPKNMNSGTSEHKSVISERTDPPDNLKVNRTVQPVGMGETQEAIF